MVDRLNMLMESRIHGDMYVRFGGEFLETCYRNIVRRRVLSLRLKSQYLFIFAGGLLGIIILFMVMYMSGVPQSVCIGFALITAPLLIWQTFSLNKKYGTHGLMKLQAVKRYPRRLINRRRVQQLLNRNRKTTTFNLQLVK